MLRLLLLLLLTLPILAQPRVTGERGEARARGHGIHAPRLASGEKADTDWVDGSKFFTADTETVLAGTWSANAAYILSSAHQSFDLDGNLAGLGLTRRSDLYLGALTYGVTDNLDVTLIGGLNGLTDLVEAQPVTAHGFGATLVAAIARWRFWEDREEGRSLALVGGPGVLNTLLLEDERYSPSGSFGAWQQSLVFRQDFAPFTADLELFYNFPLQANLNSFSQYGFNLGVGWDTQELVVPVLELNYARVLPHQGANVESLALTGGLVLKATDNFALNLAVQKNVAGRNVESFTTYLVGGSLNF